MRRLLWHTSVPTIAFGCWAAATGHRPIDTPTATPDIVGTWQLVSRLDISSDGRARAEPVLGRDPLAYLIYDRAGHVAAQLMARDRSQADCGASAVSAPSANNSTSLCRYDAYFGRYSLAYQPDSLTGTVTHVLLGTLAPRDVGRTVTRNFRLSRDTLTIWFTTSGAQSEQVTRTLVWRRVSP